MNFEEWWKDMFGDPDLMMMFEESLGGRKLFQGQSWDASRENLPKCETCVYWDLQKQIHHIGWTECTNPVVADQKLNELPPITRKDFGCIFHSKLEKK